MYRAYRATNALASRKTLVLAAMVCGTAILFMASGVSDSVVSGVSLTSHSAIGPLPTTGGAQSVAKREIVATQPASLSALATGITGQDPPGVSVDGTPSGITLDPVNGDLYVADSDSHYVSVISGANNTVVATIQVGDDPDGVAYNVGDGDVYVANSESDNVSVINGSSNKVVATVSGLDIPGKAVYDGENGDVYITNWGSPDVTLINGTSVLTTLQMPSAVSVDGIAVDSFDGWVYVTDYDSVNVYAINGTSIIATIDADLGSQDAAMFDPTNGYILVGGESGIVEIHEATVVATIPEEYVLALGFDPVTDYVYVGNAQYNPLGYGPTPSAISVINGSAVIGAPFPDVHSYPTAFAFDSANNVLYVAAEQGEEVWLLNGSAYYPSISSFLGTSTSIELDSSIPTITLSVQALPGEGPVTYSYTGLPSSCGSANTSSFACTPESAGVYLVTVLVSDRLGNSATASVAFDVVDPVTVTATAVEDPTDADADVAFEAIPSQGLAPYSYAWYFGDGGSSTAKDPTHAFAATGSYVATVWVNDSGGGSAKTSLSITVDTELVSVVTLSNATLALGQTFSLTNSVWGGVAPYTYSYLSLPPGCVSVDSPTIGCLPTQSGNYTINAFVRDANNVLVGVNTTLLVDFEFTVVIPSRSLVEHPLTVTVKPEGGYGTITYTYAGLPSGCAPANTPTITCTPNRTGNYEISITIEDAAGDRGSRVVAVDIVQARATGLPAVLTSPRVLEGAGVAFVTVLIIALVLFVARGRRQGSPSTAYAAYRSGASQGSPSASKSIGIEPEVPREDGKEPGAEDSLSDLV